MSGSQPSSYPRFVVGLAAALIFAGSTQVAARQAGSPAALATTSGPAFAPETVKAAFLVNFLRFTDRTPAHEGPYVVGVAGNRALEDELIRLAERQLVRGQRLRVVRIRSARDLDTLHLAYFDAASENRPEVFGARDALPLLEGRPVLTVSDAPDFLPLGGMIQIFREGNALRFAISPDRARSAGLQLSSRLLALATIYHGEAPPAP
jgi:hypothetical protein